MNKTVKEMDKEQRFLKKMIDGMEDGRPKKKLMGRRQQLQKAIWDEVPREDRIFAYQQVHIARVALGLK
jgi:hypothetical protein